jgi:hypothetical protein
MSCRLHCHHSFRSGLVVDGSCPCTLSAGSFHTAQNYAKAAYLMLNNGHWEVNGTVEQLLDPAWVAGAAKASPLDWTPCPYYSHFWWRKPLNSGAFIGRAGAPVPADTYYAFGGDGQFAVVVPSLDLVVVSQKGGREATLVPPPDWESYVGKEHFPQPGDKFMQVGDDGGGFGVKGGGWEFNGPAVPKSGATGGMSGGDEPNGDECDGWDAGSQNIDLLSGMMQLVVAAVKGYPASVDA